VVRKIGSSTASLPHGASGAPVIGHMPYSAVAYCPIRVTKCSSYFMSRTTKDAASASAASDLALAADVPPTTGLRKLEKLEADGFVYRVPDQCDGRRSWVMLVPKVLVDFDLLFDQAGEIFD